MKQFYVYGKGQNLSTFIWVRLFWNQNLTCKGSKPNSRLSSFLCLSSGCGHSLKKLKIQKKKPSKYSEVINILRQ